MKSTARLLALPGYIVAAVACTWPLAREIGKKLPTVVPLPDALLQAFLLNWDLRTLFTRPLQVFDVPIFHPERNTLTYMDHLLGEAVVAAPVAALTGDPAVAYNAVVLFSYVASAWAMYRLARLFTSRGASFLCGLWFALSPYRFCNMANLNLLQTEFLPLGVFFALRFTRHRRTRDLLATGLTLAVQSYFSWYYAFYLGTALAVLGIQQMIAGRAGWRSLLDRRVVAVGLSTAVLVLPGLYPYLGQRARMEGFGRSLASASLWSADLLDYFKINIENRLLARVPWLAGAQPYFPGLVAVALAWLGLRTQGRDQTRVSSPPKGPRELAATSAAGFLMGARLRGAATGLLRLARDPGPAGPFVLLGLVGLVLSLGPVLRVAGHRLWIPLPYALLFFTVPGFTSMRAPGRYAVLVLLATVMLAGLGYEWLRRRTAERRAVRALLFPVSAAVTVALAWSVPWPMIVFPHREDAPPVYRWLARQPGDFPVLDLPVPVREADEGEREVTRQLYALYHRKALVDGVSGFVPPHHRRFRVIMQRFPEPETIRAAAARGTRIVIVHYGDWEPAVASRRRAEADRAPGLRKLVEFGSDVAYEIRPNP